MTTPTLSDVIETAIRNALLNLNTAMPAEVVKYDSKKNTVDVQPSIKRKYADGTTASQPRIFTVPVCFPRSGKAAVTFPIKKGDSVLLVFSQRSLDAWKGSGGEVEAGDPRTHALSDAVAIPGVYPVGNPVPAEPDKLVVRYAKSKIKLSENGDVEIEAGSAKLGMKNGGKVSLGNGAIELLDILDKVIDEIVKITVPTAVGPSGVPVNSPAFTVLKQQLGQIKGG